MDAPNKIKFVDDDGSVAIVEPPMTSRIHKEYITEEDRMNVQEPIEEDESSVEDTVEQSSVEDAVEQSSVEDAVEHTVKELEKMETIISSSVKNTIVDKSTDENIKPSIEEGYEEALSLVASAVENIKSAEELVPIKPKGCCILQ